MNYRHSPTTIHLVKCSQLTLSSYFSCYLLSVVYLVLSCFVLLLSHRFAITMSPSAVSAGSSRRTLGRGIYVPTPTFFTATETVDVETVKKHTLRLANAGVAGLAVQGSNGEAVNLTHEERSTVTKATREALNANGFETMPLIVGCGAQSTYEAVSLCEQAAAAGGDYALILPPNYYVGLFNSTTIVDFFTEIADASPIPIIIYNYPGATPGVDLNSDVLVKLSAHPNIVGCKFTCGNTGKLGRVAAAVKASGDEFLCFSGSCDFTLSAMTNGAAGVIGGLANLAPRASIKVWDLGEKNAKEANETQAVVARGDWVAIQSGVIGVKTGLQEYFGYGGYARKPLPRPDEQERAKIRDDLKELMDFEKACSN